VSRIGCQAQKSTSAALEFARRSPIVKGVNQTEVLSAAPDDAIRIFRYRFNSQGVSDPSGACLNILGALGGYRHRNLYVETYNEMPKEALGAYIAFLQVLVPMLHGAGLKVCGPSWASGDYEQDDWNAFRAVGWCGLDAISVHGYWADKGPTVWNGLRWRTYYNDALDRCLSVYITECGRDRIRDGDNGTYIGAGGWKADGISDVAYAAEINAYGAQLLPHEWATPFINGGDATWTNYDLDSVSSMIQTGGTPVTPPPKWTPGIDVSNHQGQIDWPLVARCGPQFAVIKATEGTDYLDPYFAANWKAAMDNGLVRGAYCFGKPSKGSGHNDARHFLDVVNDQGIARGDFLVLDLEDPDVSPTADLLAYTVDWLGTVKAAVGFNALLYSGHYFLSPHNLEGKIELKNNGLWLASYQANPPPVPKGWDYWTMWQFTDRGVIPGIGNVDQNLFNGPIERLKLYGKL